jgi:hypothetical protein
MLTLSEFSVSVDAMDLVNAVLQDFISNEIEYTLKKQKDIIDLLFGYEESEKRKA